jgi:hypothetical protein
MYEHKILKLNGHKLTCNHVVSFSPGLGCLPVCTCTHVFECSYCGLIWFLIQHGAMIREWEGYISCWSVFHLCKYNTVDVLYEQLLIYCNIYIETPVHVFGICQKNHYRVALSSSQKSQLFFTFVNWVWNTARLAFLVDICLMITRVFCNCAYKVQPLVWFFVLQ